MLHILKIYILITVTIFRISLKRKQKMFKMCRCGGTLRSLLTFNDKIMWPYCLFFVIEIVAFKLLKMF